MLFLKIFGIIGVIIGGISLVGIPLLDKVIWEKIPVKKVYGEMIYGNKEAQVIYDMSKLESDGIVGMIYYTKETEDHMIDEIADNVLSGLEEQYKYKYSPEDRPYALEELKRSKYSKVMAPKLFEIKNAVLLQNRITKRYVIEGDIKLWTQ